MLVYICSRYRADNEAQFQMQLAYTKIKAKEEVLKGNDVLVCMRHGVSEGMEAEIKVATENNIRIVETVY